MHPAGNLLKHIKVRKGDMEQGFAEADVVLEHTFHTAASPTMPSWSRNAALPA